MANYDPWAGSSTPLVFAKKKFYRHVGTRFIYLCIFYGFFHTIMVELSACNRHCIAHKPKTFPIGPLRKMFATDLVCPPHYVERLPRSMVVITYLLLPRRTTLFPLYHSVLHAVIGLGFLHEVKEAERENQTHVTYRSRERSFARSQEKNKICILKDLDFCQN